MVFTIPKCWVHKICMFNEKIADQIIFLNKRKKTNCDKQYKKIIQNKKKKIGIQKEKKKKIIKNFEKKRDRKIIQKKDKVLHFCDI